MQTFVVNQSNDWHPVTAYLTAIAAADPLSKPDSENYSDSEETAYARARRIIAAGRIKEATSHSALVIYRENIAISLVLTIEPNHIHLSLTRVVMNSDRMQRAKLVSVSDRIAHEVTQHLLGPCEERREGALTAVRHYYRTFA